MKYILAICTLVFFGACKAQPGVSIPTNSDENTLLWEISGKGLTKPSYLFGTFHLMCREDIHFSKNLTTALAEVSEVYFEMDLDDPSNTLGAFLFMNMKDGKTLKSLYTTEEYERLERYFKDSLKMNLSMFQKMKPNFLDAFLFPKMMPCKNMSGVEQEIMQLAQKDKKEIKGFETIAFQASVFDSIPYEEQAKELLTTIDSINIYGKYFDSMLTVYKTQQLSAIEPLFNNPKINMSEGSMDLLLDKRNKNWVAQLKKILPGTNIFMAVGAGHLVGVNGLISLLKKEGYTLRPLLNK